MLTSRLSPPDPPPSVFDHGTTLLSPLPCRAQAPLFILRPPTPPRGPHISQTPASAAHIRARTVTLLYHTEATGIMVSGVFAAIRISRLFLTGALRA
ncbi:hypothetical protein J6590_038495 [Homalodisca vitripennis]|nr:hypothetical protein J6590_038495 [Homalodisca vitripennis]